MITDQSGSPHRAEQAADCAARSATEAPAFLQRNKPITHYLPDAKTLRRCREWQTMERPGPWKPRLAYHEAGHIVLMEWLGAGNGLKAEISVTGGLAHWPEAEPDSKEKPDQGPNGINAAVAASVYHAGRMAELIADGKRWTGPIYYRDSDFQKAADILADSFGHPASGAHAFAQTVAMNVLSDRWERVQEIAEHLIEHGRWELEA